MVTLIITEKNKAAAAIADAIGPTKLIKKSKSLRIFQNSSKNIYILPLRGHLRGYRNTTAFKSWKNTNPREIITNPKAIKKLPLNYAGPYIKAIKEYSTISDHCIIGTDADIEGTNIGLFDALPYVKQVKPNIKVSQLWLSSLQKGEILNKMNNLITPKYSWGASGEARAIIDAIIVFSATREVTNTLKPLLSKLNIKFTSIGRVQTCLLYLIFLREKEILDFVPEPYILIEAILIYNNKNFKAQHQLNPFKKDRFIEAKEVFNKIKDEKIAKIVENSKNLKKRFPPTPLNTSKALVLLTKNLKISANTAMNTMNSLYLNKVISYPRTDSDIYKSEFDHVSILSKLKIHSLYGHYTNYLINQNKLTPTKGKKDAGDHPPITPLEGLELNDNKLENDLQRKVYDLLARHYIALFGQAATESKQILKLLIKDEPFIAQVVSLISEGFLEIAPFLKPKYETEIQIPGNVIPIQEILLSEKETKPPPKYTDTTLLKLMDKNNIGTKSTRPIIIKLLQTRRLIKRIKYVYYITDFGFFLIENLVKIWLPFLEPSFTRSVEKRLEDIKNKKKSMDSVVNDIKKEFLELFDKFLINKQKLVSNIENFKDKTIKLESSRSQHQFTTSNCPFCEKVPMKFINLKNKRFLVCSDENCKKYLSLPKNGALELLNSTCLKCGFNIFKVHLKRKGKLYVYHLCPKCWNDGFKEKIGDRFCSNCMEYKISNDKCVKK
jgi:DNA topoisomerase-1